MIIDKLETIDVKSNKQLDTQNFRIDPSYINKMIWLTINQYKYSIRTPLQEIISNAKDANIEANKADTPIKITLPTNLDMTFKVRDFGKGLTPNDMHDVFTSFGASTKNTSNGQVGGFGIGAKSPLRYTNQFNVCTYVDGRFWHYVVHGNIEGGISLTLLSEGITQEVNGTEVQIPVKNGDRQTFIESAVRCTMFWKVQPLFNLKEYNNLELNSIKVNDQCSIYKKHDLFRSEAIVLVGEIPYELDRYEFRLDTHSFNGLLVIKCGIADIKVLQTRESIDNYDKNKELLKTIVDKFQNDLAILKEKVIDRTSLKTVLESCKKYYNVLDLKKIKYLGYEIQNDLISSTGLGIKLYNHRSIYGSITKKLNERTTYNISLDKKSIVIYDDIRKKESTLVKKRRIKQAMLTHDNVYLINKGNKAEHLKKFYTLFGDYYTKLSEIEPLMPVKQARVKSNNTKVPRNSIEFCMGIGQLYSTTFINEWFTLDTIKSDTTYIYVLKDGNAIPPTESSLRNYIINLGNHKLVALSNKSFKMIKDLPNFKTLEQFKSEIVVKDEIVLKYFRNTHLQDTSKLLSYLFRCNKRNTNKVLRAYLNKFGTYNSKTMYDDVNFPNYLILESKKYNSLVKVHNRLSSKLKVEKGIFKTIRHNNLRKEKQYLQESINRSFNARF